LHLYLNADLISGSAKPFSQSYFQAENIPSGIGSHASIYIKPGRGISKDTTCIGQMLFLLCSGSPDRFEGKDKSIKVKSDMMVNMEPEEIRNEVVLLLKRYDVKRAAFFGSFVRGEHRGDSDIDILVEFEGEKSLLDLARLKIELEKVLRRRVDVLTYGSLHPLLRDRILQEQKVIL